ncbi:sensor domain-containing diguanylate cyclase [Undibacterium oligocarboniphilum]|uniref:Diguanylate cyclase n=1 Tax=Undibacterium oligocarboniphilum TaxID=666702 RepID=A0A850QGF7_9BURK|nr:sensor domain-containing diguanylate cyclase [Undibacterium oligocarboniphilum]MBC3870934.1 diguanylate cyclase [Undibacterium oligocarboniphilum]NVO76443.1 diguanylate cyclase [Undibacterium oligocarboniphilum]
MDFRFRFLKQPQTRPVFLGHLRLISLGLAASLLLALTASYILSRISVAREAIERTSILARNLSDSLLSGDQRTMQNMILNSGLNKSLRSLTVFDQQGNPIYAWEKGNLINTEHIAPVVPTPGTRQLFLPNSLETSVPILDKKTLKGEIILRESLTPLHDRLLLELMLGMLAAMLIALPTAIALTRKSMAIIAPVLKLATVAEQVATLGDYSLRAAADNEKQLGNLTMHFNLMLARMEAWENDMRNESVEQRATESRLSILDNHDSVTKLPNRHYFHRLITNSVEDAVERQELMALMFIDLDHFRRVSDHYGYDVCDQLLASLAQRLCEILRSTDTLCRVGADEFAAVLPDIDHLDTVRKLAERLIVAMQQPLIVNGRQHAITCSIGIACCPLHTHEQRLLLQHADQALKAAKLAGRNVWRLYDPNQMSRVRQSG